MTTLSEEAEMAKHARWPMWLGVSYAALVGAALVFALQPGGEGLRGVWAVLLALPWSAPHSAFSIGLDPLSAFFEAALFAPGASP